MRFYYSDGTNCLACCVAGLFNRPIGITPAAPSFAKETDNQGDWWHRFELWCRITLHHAIVIVQTDDPISGLWNIEIGYTEDNIAHAVICFGRDVFFNPSPQVSNTHPLAEKGHRYVFVPLAGATYNVQDLVYPEEVILRDGAWKSTQ